MAASESARENEALKPSPSQQQQPQQLSDKQPQTPSQQQQQQQQQSATTTQQQQQLHDQHHDHPPPPHEQQLQQQVNGNHSPQSHEKQQQLQLVTTNGDHPSGTIVLTTTEADKEFTLSHGTNVLQPHEIYIKAEPLDPMPPLASPANAMDVVQTAGVTAVSSAEKMRELEASPPATVISLVPAQPYPRAQLTFATPAYDIASSGQYTVQVSLILTLFFLSPAVCPKDHKRLKLINFYPSVCVYSGQRRCLTSSICNCDSKSNCTK